MHCVRMSRDCLCMFPFMVMFCGVVEPRVLHELFSVEFYGRSLSLI